MTFSYRLRRGPKANSLFCFKGQKIKNIFSLHPLVHNPCCSSFPNPIIKLTQGHLVRRHVRSNVLCTYARSLERTGVHAVSLRASAFNHNCVSITIICIV
jgi:hypothetical protein